MSCPTCQFSAPFLERLHETYGGEKFTLWGISQDDAEDTREFCKEFDVDFPILLEAPGYALSNKYGLTHVPSIFLISPDGKIQETSIGFSKDESREDCGRRGSKPPALNPRHCSSRANTFRRLKPG